MCSGMNRNGMTTSDGTVSGFTFGSTGTFGFGQSAQLASLQSQSMQNAASNVAAAMRQHPTTTQFVQAAMRFDGDGDQELNGRELKLVAAAVVKELRAREQLDEPGQPLARGTSLRNQSRRRVLPPDSTTPELTSAFVKKAMTFDRDNSGTLSSRESLAMAAALIRTLQS